MKKIFISLIFISLFTCTTNAATFIEQGDAGELLNTAQNAIGNGTSDTITGTLIDLGNGVDDIDLFEIFISDTSAFSITVSANLTQDNDAQLYLFDSTGAQVAFDDDGNGLLPMFNAGVISGLPSGNYFLAFNLFSTTPIFTAGSLSGWNRAPGPFQTGDYTLSLTGELSTPPLATPVPTLSEWSILLLIFLIGFIGLNSNKAKLFYRKA